MIIISAKTNLFPMSDNIESTIIGKLVKNHTIIDNTETQRDLELKGLGEFNKSDFFLKPFESLYLLYTGKLNLRCGNKKIKFDDFLQTCIKADPDALTKFLIFRDLRTKGYIVRDGFGFGSDFRVYERGQFGNKDAKYLVFALNEGKQEKIGKLQKKIEEITKMGKEPIISVIERRGEIIYYKISRINFLKNKVSMDMQDFDFS